MALFKLLSEPYFFLKKVLLVLMLVGYEVCLGINYTQVSRHGQSFSFLISLDFELYKCLLPCITKPQI